jgi:hypothetical protein
LLGIIVEGLKRVTMMCFRGKTDIRGASYRQKVGQPYIKKENFLIYKFKNSNLMNNTINSTEKNINACICEWREERK